MRLTEHQISSPKRDGRAQTTWERFFPYYAGFPETFANDVLISLNLKAGATVLDPWNGSGALSSACIPLALKMENIMSLQEKLDAFKADFEAGKPPYNVPPSVIETMHRATAELITTEAAQRAKGRRYRTFVLAQRSRGEHR